MRENHVIFAPDEVRQVRYKKGQITTKEEQYPVAVNCEGTINQKKIKWRRTKNQAGGKTTYKYAKNFINLSKEIQEKVRQGEDVLLPLLAYYGTGRLWLQKRDKTVEPAEIGSRTLGYIDCLEPASNEKLFLQWFKSMEQIALQHRESIQILDAVKAAVAKCVNEAKIIYDFREDGLIAFTSEQILPFRMLSDGVRNMLAMVADIAYRAAVLNPHLEKEAAQKTPGIVLIDEIDLHLHPKWQQRVVEDLQRTFPSIQFIATTHSPFIIQSLYSGKLINLDPQEGEYHNKSPEDIVEDVMGVDLPQRSKRWKDMMQAAEEYYKVLEEAEDASSEEIEKLKTKLDELTLPFSDDPAYQAFLKMEREAAGLGEKHETD